MENQIENISVEAIENTSESRELLEEEQNDTEAMQKPEDDAPARLCWTKKGNGVKLVFNGQWMYASKKEFFRWLNDKQDSCPFRWITESKPLVC